MWNYDDDILSRPGRHRREVPRVTLTRGLVVEVASDGFVGTVTALHGDEVELQDRRGRARRFGLHPGAFLLDGQPVTLVAPTVPTARRTSAPTVTASGSFAVPGAAPRVARPSRIFVEGLHDAELVEKIWGDDLRVEGIVVEYVEGIDDLPDIVRRFGPGPAKRLGVLVDHLVPGSKEHRIVGQVRHPQVLVTGHPFVDIWEAVKPSVMGIDAWPTVPRGTPWKEGVCAALGYASPADLWRELRGRASRYTDLDRSLVGAVEQLIDFVTEPDRT